MVTRYSDLWIPGIYTETSPEQATREALKTLSDAQLSNAIDQAELIPSRSQNLAALRAEYNSRLGVQS